LGICLATGWLAAGCVDPGLAPPGDGGVDAEPGPTVALLAPLDGEEAPVNLAVIVLASEDRTVGEMLAGVMIVGPDGAAVEAEARWPSTADPDEPFCAGRAERTCVVVDVAEPLAANATYSVTVPGTGLAMPFRTGGDYDLDPPAAALAAVASDGCLVARAAGDEPAWAVLVAGGAHVVATDGLAREHEVGVAWIGSPEQVEPLLVLVDLAGNTSRIAGPPLTPGPATLVISEVLANPAGPEPAQEWVEVANLTQEDVQLLGLAIVDATGADLLPDVTLPAGGRALVVPAGYDEAAPGDIAPPEGTVLARVEGGTLGGNGLANAGETVTLLGTAGETLSVLTSYFDTSGSSWQGRSVERIRPGGCDVKGNAAPNVTGSATPGTRNSVE
jgi:hypothetical protein